jgi:hypothetical protein
VASSIERGNQQAQFAEIDAQLAIAERKLVRYGAGGRRVESGYRGGALRGRGAEEAPRRRGASIGAAEPLRAPVSGVIGAASVVAGQVVEAKEILFEVIDPARLAVEALAYDAALAEGIAAASAPLPGNGALELQFVGGGRQLREQALPLLFRVKSKDAPVAVGQPLKVIARHAAPHRARLLPRAALVKTGAGETAVWVRDGAERFLCAG